MNNLFTPFNLTESFPSEHLINNYFEHINIHSNDSNNFYNGSYSEQNSSFIKSLNSSSMNGMNVNRALIINNIFKKKSSKREKRNNFKRKKNKITQRKNKTIYKRYKKKLYKR